jgi:hypothetical protein
MDFNVEGQVELGRAPQALTQNFFLDLELVLVTGVLVVATATAAKIWAGRLDAMGRWLDDGFHRRSRESRLLLGQGGIDFFSRQNEGDEDGLAASTVVGRQAGEAITAIDQLFDCEEQELILRYEEGLGRFARDPSLRLKIGCAQDDSDGVIEVPCMQLMKNPSPSSRDSAGQSVALPWR